MIRIIVCGFQTGVDLGAAMAAKKAGVSTYGFMPRGFRNEAGMFPEYEHEYGAIETSSREYPVRTEMNIKISDAVLWIGEKHTFGKMLTKRLAIKYGRPIREIKLPISTNDFCAIFDFLTVNNFESLMIAGHSESKYKGIQEKTYKFCLELFDTIGISTSWPT